MRRHIKISKYPLILLGNTTFIWFRDSIGFGPSKPAEVLGSKEHHIRCSVPHLNRSKNLISGCGAREKRKYLDICPWHFTSFTVYKGWSKRLEMLISRVHLSRATTRTNSLVQPVSCYLKMHRNVNEHLSLVGKQERSFYRCFIHVLPTLLFFLNNKTKTTF